VPLNVGDKVDFVVDPITDGNFDAPKFRAYMKVELPTAAPGGPYTLPYMGTLNLDGSGSDPGGGTIITDYLWDLNNDGTFGDVTGVNPTVSYSDLVDTWGMVPYTEHTIALKVIGTTGEAIATTTLSPPPPVPVPEPASLGLLGLALLGLRKRRS
jgi:hypothetical protein